MKRAVRVGAKEYLIPEFHSPEWFKKGLCRGLAFRTSPTNSDKFFFPKQQNSAEVKYTKRMCSTCPVMKECLEYAIENGEEGIWGGTTQDERREIRTVRRKKRYTERRKVKNRVA